MAIQSVPLRTGHENRLGKVLQIVNKWFLFSMRACSASDFHSSDRAKVFQTTSSFRRIGADCKIDIYEKGSLSSGPCAGNKSVENIDISPFKKAIRKSDGDRD